MLTDWKETNELDFIGPNKSARLAFIHVVGRSHHGSFFWHLPNTSKIPIDLRMCHVIGDYRLRACISGELLGSFGFPHLGQCLARVLYLQLSYFVQLVVALLENTQDTKLNDQPAEHVPRPRCSSFLV